MSDHVGRYLSEIHRPTRVTRPKLGHIVPVKFDELGDERGKAPWRDEAFPWKVLERRVEQREQRGALARHIKEPGHLKCHQAADAQPADEIRASRLDRL